MLSMMLEISLGGICSRMKPSIRSQRLAVSSMRVPARARRCSLNCPASTLGKKSRPSQGTSSTNEPTHTDGKAPQERARGDAGSAPASRDSGRGIFRTPAQRPPASAPADCGWSCSGVQLPVHGRAAGTWPWSAPASGTASRRRAWRTPPPPPAARTGSGPRR